MIRRWLIRGLALTLLTLCVVAWVGSYFQQHWFGRYAWDRYSICVLAYGSIIWDKYDLKHVENPMEIRPWRPWSDWLPPELDFTPWGHRAPKNWTLGFAYMPWDIRGEWNATVPLWFPTLLSALLLWFVWRKTRPAYNGRGFPVEVAANGKVP
jgi:hypothetical protein